MSTGHGDAETIEKDSVTGTTGARLHTPAPQPSAVASPTTVPSADQDHSNHISLYSDQTQWPAWLSPVVAHLSTILDTPIWTRLVSNFTVHEKSSTTTTSVSYQHYNYSSTNSCLTDSTRLNQPTCRGWCVAEKKAKI
jgi:hypothetical protein